MVAGALAFVVSCVSVAMIFHGWRKPDSVITQLEPSVSGSIAGFAMRRYSFRRR